MLTKSMMDLAIFAAFSNPAETRQSTGGSRRKGKQPPPPAIIEAAAKTHGAGQGKDAVPAGKDYTKPLTDIAMQYEVPGILTQIRGAGERIKGWIAVGQLAQAHGLDDKVKKDILDRYVAISRSALVKQIFEDQGMLASWAALGDSRGEKKTWPEVVQKIYDSQVGPRLAETRKVMAGFEKQFLPTVNVLQGKGTVQEKLATLPNVTTQGRKKGSSNNNKGTGTTDGSKTPEVPNVGPAEQKQQDISDAMLSQAANVSPAALPTLFAVLAKTGRGNRMYEEDVHFRALCDAVAGAVGKYEAAMSAHEAAQAEKNKGKK